MNYSGKLVAVAMIAVALAAAAFSLWYRQRATARALDYWGSQYAVLFARAPSGQASELTMVAQRVAVDDYAVGKTVELSGARGFENVRRMFLEDIAYAWDKPAPRSPRWRYLLRFTDGGAEASLVLTEDATCLRRLDSDSAAAFEDIVFNPSAAREITELLRQALQDQESKRSGEQVKRSLPVYRVP